ncbi:MAG: diguanylate cyclase [Nitrospirae bacterium]|nr:diguanylate cyclase [Nitrospirota bacterium]
MSLKGKILYKFGGVILLLLAIHLIVVIIGLYTSKRLSGDAAEINYAGSVRMRSFKIGFLLDRMETASEKERPMLKKEIEEERGLVKEVLYGLRDGNPKYGLPGEKNKKILNQLNMIIREWEEVISPLIKRVIDVETPDEARTLISRYNDNVVAYVSSVDKTVRLFESGSEKKLDILRLAHYLLLIPAVIVSLFAIFMIFFLIEKPVRSFVLNMKRVERGDLDARIEIKSCDEFSFMADVFNQMISELKRSHRALETSAITDSLTGILNYRGFQGRLGDEFKRIARSRESLSLIIADIDNFKDINDTHGHPGGDLLLKKVAIILTQVAREIDIIARYGGDEFLVLLVNTGKEQAITTAERIRKTVEEMALGFGEKRSYITLSLGIATTPMDTREKEELIELADKALYHAKKGGKNQTRHYSEI